MIPDCALLHPAHVRRSKQARDAAMRRACLEYRYATAAAAREAGVHYSKVSKIIKEKGDNRDVKTNSIPIRATTESGSYS